MTFDLRNVPPPTVIEPLDFETILAEMVADLKARDPAYDAILESDPAIIVLEVAAARELIIRQRVNDALRATLLAFAAGTDLDNVAAFYGVARLDGEDDGALRSRTVDRIKGWSSAGGAAHYRFFATSADPRVKDVAVDSPETGRVRISVLSKNGDGTPPPDLLAAVRAAVTKDDVRVLTDTVDVVAATVVPVTIRASVWLYPDTPLTVFDRLGADFRTAFTARAGLGWDLALSWIIRTLHADGVQRIEVEAPAADVLVDDTSSAAIGSLELTLKGRTF